MNLFKKLFVKINSFLRKEPLTKDELISLIRKSHEKIFGLRGTING